MRIFSVFKTNCFTGLVAIPLFAFGCSEPQCPRGYEDMGDRCYRIKKDAGLDGSVMETADASGLLQDATFPALTPDASDPAQVNEASVLEDAAHVDAQRDSGGDAPDADPFRGDGSAGPVAADSSTADSAAGDASSQPDDCRTTSCKNGGVCAVDAGSYRCSCPDEYTGSNCELEICGDTPIRTRQDVENHRLCAEIHGTFQITAVGLNAIEGDDFPFLTRITGDLVIVGLHATNGAATNLQSVTLSKLEAVEGSILVISNVVTGAAESGPLSELHLPLLTTVGVSLQAVESTLRVLDLPLLSTVDGAVILRNVGELCTLNMRKITRVGELNLSRVPRIASPLFVPLRSATTGMLSQNEVGCCWPNTADRVSCSAFVSGCAGCGTP